MGEYFVVGRSAPAPQNRCICHRLNFLGTTVSTSYRIETLRAPNRPVERGHTRFLYQGSRRFIFTILLKSLFHEKSTRMYSNISSSFLPPPFFLVHFFFYQTHHLSSNLPFTLLELTLLPPVELQRNFWIASRPIPSTLLPLYFSSAGVDRPG